MTNLVTPSHETAVATGFTTDHFGVADPKKSGHSGDYCVSTGTRPVQLLRFPRGAPTKFLLG